jgi:hypothetical protein
LLGIYIVVSIISSNQTASIVHDNCVGLNQVTRVGNARGYVLRDFLLSAARAREASAHAESDPDLVATDLEAANQYRQLAARLQIAPLRKCS